MMCGCSISLYPLIPNNMSEINILIFKIAIPLFISIFLFYGFGFYYIIRLTCGSRETLKKLNGKKNFQIIRFVC